MKKIFTLLFTILYIKTCFAQFTTSGATTADSSWIVYTTKSGILPFNSSKGLIIRDTSWMRFKTRMVIIDSLSGNRNFEIPTTLMWVKKGNGCDTLEISPLDSIKVKDGMIISLSYLKLTGTPIIPNNTNQLTNGAGFITGYSETDPLSVHLTDSASMLTPYLRFSLAATTYVLKSITINSYPLSGNVSLTTSDINEGTNLYFTNSRSRTSVSLTTTGSGVSTYNNSTGVLNIPTPSAGTVTSIGLTSSDITVGGSSPITTSGTYTLTLPTVNSNIGTFNNLTITAKGLVTAGSNTSYLTGNQTVTLSGDITGSGATSISTTLANSGVSAATYNGSYTTDAKGRITAANNAFFNNSASHSIVTVAGAANGFQVSSTKLAIISYSVKVITAVQIGVATNVEGYVILEIAATNSSTAGDWTEIGRTSNGQNIGLALALSSTQSVGGQISGVLPPGYYARLRSVNVSGTPTYSYVSGQEIIY